MAKKVALLDADGLVYAAGAVSETVMFRVDGIEFDYKSQANDHADDIGIPRSEIEPVVYPQPVSHALNAIRTTFDSIMEKTETDHVETYLSNLDHDNFRLHIYPEYKANRDKAHRPHHFDAIRNWLQNQRVGQITPGLEPDDMLAIRAHELMAMGTPYVLVTNDKDLNQIPGDHYNWKTHEFHTVSPWEATVSLYTQILVGDSIDNIKGCPKIGPVKAREALKDAKTEEDLLEAAFALYKDYYKDEKVAREMFTLNTKLVRMVRVRPEATNGMQ